MEKSDIQSRRESIQELINVGLFRYMKDVNLYHGRANTSGETFVVKNLNNSGNNTGNLNVSGIQGLYTASEQVAKQFAEARTKKSGGKAEVHKIVGINDDDLIIDLSFELSKIKSESRKKVEAAFANLAKFSVSCALPINFKYKNIYFDVIFPVLKSQKRALYSEGEEKAILKLIKEQYRKTLEECKKTGNRHKLASLYITESQLEKLALDYVFARNTQYLLSIDPVTTIWDSIDGTIVRLNDTTYTVSREYLSAWLYNNHIAGFKFYVQSATIDKKIEICQLVNVKQIMTEKEHGEYLQYMFLLEQVADKMFKNIFSKEIEEFIKTANGSELISYVSKDLACKKLYDKDAGIWEGWNVGQHSACVVDFFNKYYSNSIPESMHSIMKLILLAHDIGKGEAVEKGITQKRANFVCMDTLFDYMNIPTNIRKLVKFVVNDSQRYTSEILLKSGQNESELEQKKFTREKYFIKMLNNECYNILYENFKGKPTSAEVDTLRNLCLILQFCDSGAYTFYAKIKENNAFVSGGNQNFTNSFEMTNKNTPVLKKAQQLGLLLVSNEKEKSRNLEDVTNPLLVL